MPSSRWLKRVATRFQDHPTNNRRTIMFDLGRSFLASVERRPQAIAVADGALHKSYETWYHDIQSVAKALEGFGLSKGDRLLVDRKSTRLNSSHVRISYAVFC